jgi:hypothetical protein
MGYKRALPEEYTVIEEERWLNCSAPDCKSVVLGSNPALSQHPANSVSPVVGSHPGRHSTVCWPLSGGKDTYTQKPLKYIGGMYSN